jgi:hypothetical protein
LEHEKIELCGDRRNVRVGGVGQTLMVELRINDVKLDVSFLMHYQLIQIERQFFFSICLFIRLIFYF